MYSVAPVLLVLFEEDTHPPQKSLNAVVVAVVGQEMKDTFEVASISASSDHNTALTEKQTLVGEYSEMQQKWNDSLEVDLWKILIVGWIHYGGRPKYGQSTYRLTTTLCQKRSSSLPQFINPFVRVFGITNPTFDIENCGSEKCSSEEILRHVSTPPKVCFSTWDDISDVISGRAGDQKDRRWVKATIIENSIGFLRPALSRLKYRWLSSNGSHFH